MDIEEIYHDHALTLLRWLAYARSPPTLSELVEAAVTNPIYESSIDSDNCGGLEDTLNILSGLVTLEVSRNPDAKGHLVTRIHTRDASMMDHDQLDVTLYGQGLDPDTRARLAHRPNRTINFEGSNFNMIQRNSNPQSDVPIRTSADTELS